MSQAPFSERLDQEGRGLVEQATQQGLGLRLLGGMGIRLLLDDAYPRNLARNYGDLDLIIRRRDARALEPLLVGRGWQPAVAFNALNGARRMLFHDPGSPAQVDVFVETFEMCHKLPLSASLDWAGKLTLPAADLLMSKLQIVHLNAKDRNDCYALQIGCATAGDDLRRLDIDRIADLTREDWGINHTFELNIEVLDQHVDQIDLDQSQVGVVREGLATLRQAMHDAPKTRSWKLRAKIGERKRWYDEPEEVDREGGHD